MIPSNDQIRESLVQAIPLTTSSHGEAPERRHLYMPPGHAKALRLECNLVIGARGVGKSFWTAALRAQDLRQTLGKSVRELESTEVHVGFGVAPDIDAFPDMEVFGQLIGKGFDPFEIWKGVVVRWLSRLEPATTLPSGTWEQTIQWVRDNPELLARIIQHTNSSLTARGKFGLILFDALDRTSNDWEMMDRIVRDLLRVVLWLKSYPRLHAKVFLREDQSDRTITNFPDASKLLATKAELTWASHDLHGLLWQTLCNAPGDDGISLRYLYASVIGKEPHYDQAWLVADDVKREGPKQRELFNALAGPWMGRDRRRGVPYIWSVSHLADGRGRTSPRSFLAAIRQAAEDSIETYPDHGLPLHFESIKRGVQKASQIRVLEMAEDYPWVPKVMDPLEGLTVPCLFELVEERWASNLPSGLAHLSDERLPPQHEGRGWSGVRGDLERLGIFETMKDGRINLPDLYRVGFGLGRRGGVKPVK